MSPLLYAAWMPSVLRPCTVGSLPGTESLLPMSLAPGWTEAHTQHHLHRQSCLWEPPERTAGCTSAREGCSETLPVSPCTADFSTCPCGGTSCMEPEVKAWGGWTQLGKIPEWDNAWRVGPGPQGQLPGRVASPTATPNCPTAVSLRGIHYPVEEERQVKTWVCGNLDPLCLENAIKAWDLEWQPSFHTCWVWRHRRESSQPLQLSL